MNRRDFLKTGAVSLLSLAALTLGCGTANNAPLSAAAQNTSEGVSQTMNTNGKKILVAYFSWSGNTQALAENIHTKAGGDVYQIVPEIPYSQTYSVVVDKAKQEQQSNARPVLQNKLASIEQYDVIFVGYPNWWGSMPMPVATFMESYNWQGKTLVPFFTHGGGGVQNCDRDLRKLAPGAVFGDYLCLAGNRAKNSDNEVSAWLNELKL